MRVAVVGATGRIGRLTVGALERRGHETVGISRTQGVDVHTGDGLMMALTGVDAVVDAIGGRRVLLITTKGRLASETGEDLVVADELVHAITASGTPDEAKAKVEEYKKRGCTCPILYPVGGNFKLLIDTFAQN